MSILRKSHLLYSSTILLCLALMACSKNGNSGNSANGNPPDTPVDADTTVIANYTFPFVTDSTFVQQGIRTGELVDSIIPEASGIAASRKYTGLLWTHNDSGNPNDIFLVNDSGRIVSIVTLAGCTNRDWEDIAVGPGPDNTKSYVYVGEIGDNNSQYGSYSIFRFPEPDVMQTSHTTYTTVNSIDKINFIYLDGSHNAEALMIDPKTKDIYVVSKGNEAGVYVARYPQRTDTTIVLKKLAVLPLTLVTAGDISSDGSQILMKNYLQVFYWKKESTETIAQAMERTPVSLPYVIEAQGEAIGWSPDTKCYYTTSEERSGIKPGIYKYNLQ